MEEVRPDLYHIHDRFHLIQNLWYLHDQVMKKVLPSKIRKNGEPEVPVLVAETKQALRQKENAERKWARIQEAKALRKEGYSCRRIGKLLSCSPVTVSKYLSMQEPPSPYRSKRPKPLDAHEERVIEMIEKGRRIKNIHAKLTEQHNYKGTYGAVRTFVTDIRKKKKHGQTLQAHHYYSRKYVRKLLWQNPLEEKEKRMVINEILERYPVLGPFYAFLDSFRTTISSRDAEGFRSLIIFEKQREDPLTKTFITRLLTDFQPTLHALMNEDSNGYVEGQINRLKMMKRLLYGRASFPLLRVRMLYRIQ